VCSLEVLHQGVARLRTVQALRNIRRLDLTVLHGTFQRTPMANYLLGHLTVLSGAISRIEGRLSVGVAVIDQIR
jgi:hypothetical protein